MKIRSGFVSNSSSSSFIVKATEVKYKPSKKNPGYRIFAGWKKLLTAKQVAALKKFGFRKTWASTPSQVPSTEEEWIKHGESVKKETGFGYSWGYEVTCNQDDVTQFLLKNKIPFVAEEHYGHNHLFYDDKADKVTVAENFGVRMSMYGTNDVTDTSKAVQTFTREQYLKKVSWK